MSLLTDCEVKILMYILDAHDIKDYLKESHMMLRCVLSPQNRNLLKQADYQDTKVLKIRI